MTIEEIFLIAVDKVPAERSAYLDCVCAGDVELRAQVDALVQAHDEAGSLLEMPLFRTTATVDHVASGDEPGRVVGPYKLIEPIGEGGMGRVWMAQQTEPIRRTVAVKLIKLGMDSRQVLARFDAERQALALMDHPNIAKVHDAGVASDGRPYFVMELIKGQPITKYCDEHQLTPRQRLNLFVPVCHAIQHAHQKGIIHRDLKPSNVLVALYDGKPVPKVIDFGVAKAAGQPLTEQTLVTGFGAIVGTLEYMSPEQAEINQLDIDTRSDIYSLGVLLYELLTGTTPLDRKRVNDSGMLEALRIIREEETPTLSNRLATTALLPAIAANRGMEPATLTKLVRGELDWIVMKALEKDRSRRYETANGFAMDVQRYLADEPVQACPPNAWYRVHKFARRNRGPVLAVAGVAFALVVGVFGTAWGLVRAANARADTTTEVARREAAVRDADAAQVAARLNRRLADERHFASHQEEIRALRTSRRPGQRFESLAVLRRATNLARSLELPGERIDELRDATVAALALTDLYPVGPWVPWPEDSYSVDFDAAHSLYVRTDRKGNCSVRRVADDAEIYRLPGRGLEANPSLAPNGRFLAVTHSVRNPSIKHVAVELWALEPTGADRIWSDEKGFTAAFHPSLPRFAVTHADGTIRLFELPSLRLIKHLPPDTLREVGIALHPTENIVAVRDYLGSVVQLRDLSTGTVIAVLPKVDRAMCLAWHPDGRTLAIGLEAAQIRLYDRATLQLVRTLESEQAVSWVEFNPTGDRLAATGWGKSVELFDVGTGRRLLAAGPAMGHPHFNRDGGRLSGALKNGKIGFWQIGDGREYRNLVRRDMPEKTLFADYVTVSPDGRLLAAVMQDGIGFWDWTSGAELAFIPHRDGAHKRILFEPSGALLVLARNGLSRWPINQDPMARDRLIVGPPKPLALPCGSALGQSSDGRVIVTCSRAISIEQPHAGGWVLHEDRPNQPIRLDPGADIEWITVSPDGRFVVTMVQESGLAKVWDARSGNEIKTLAKWGAGYPRFSPDSRWLSTGLDGGRLIEVGTWEPGPRIGGTGSFAPDGKLAAVPTRNAIRLVEVATGRTLVSLEDPHQEYVWPSFTPDGTQLIGCANGKDKGIRVWNLRLIRKQLKELGIDWDWEEFPADAGDRSDPVRALVVNLGDSGRPSREQRVRENIARLRQNLAAKPENPSACNNLAWEFVMAPEPLRDTKAAVPLAEKAVRLSPQNAIFVNTLGVAYFRAGQYRKATEVLQPNLPRQDDKYLAYDLYVLAMCHHHLGETSRAREYYDLAARWARTPRDLSEKELEELNDFRAEAAAVFKDDALGRNTTDPPERDMK